MMEGSTKLQFTSKVWMIKSILNLALEFLNLFVVTSRISLIRFLLIYVIYTDFIIKSNLNLIN